MEAASLSQAKKIVLSIPASSTSIGPSCGSPILGMHDITDRLDWLWHRVWSAVQSLFCRSSQGKNLHLFSTFALHILFHSCSPKEPANWMVYANFVEYCPLDLNLHSMPSSWSVKFMCLINVQSVTNWFISALVAFRSSIFQHCRHRQWLSCCARLVCKGSALFPWGPVHGANEHVKTWYFSRCQPWLWCKHEVNPPLSCSIWPAF
jgi:hypothetical protein